jgi:hypothetical protein
MRHGENAAAIALAAILTFGSVASAQDKSVRIFVTTDPADAYGFVEGDTRLRADAVKNIKKYLEKKLTLVDSPQQSDIVVQILSCADEKSEDTAITRDPWGVLQAKHDEVVAVYAELRIGDYKFPIVGLGYVGEEFNPWSGAAHGVAVKVEKWLHENEKNPQK